jgi:hypothetical protein
MKFPLLTDIVCISIIYSILIVYWIIFPILILTHFQLYVRLWTFSTTAWIEHGQNVLTFDCSIWGIQTIRRYKLLHVLLLNYLWNLIISIEPFARLKKNYRTYILHIWCKKFSELPKQTKNGYLNIWRQIVWLGQGLVKARLKLSQSDH